MNNMGTRARIIWNGIPLFTTHWDGHPESLGAELLDTNTPREVYLVAKRFSINSVSKQAEEILGMPADKFDAHAYQLNPMSQQDTEFSYVFKDGEWFYRPLRMFSKKDYGISGKREATNSSLKNLKAEVGPDFVSQAKAMLGKNKEKSGNKVLVKAHTRKVNGKTVRVKSYWRQK